MRCLCVIYKSILHDRSLLLFPLPANHHYCIGNTAKKAVPARKLSQGDPDTNYQIIIWPAKSTEAWITVVRRIKDCKRRRRPWTVDLETSASDFYRQTWLQALTASGRGYCTTRTYDWSWAFEMFCGRHLLVVFSHLIFATLLVHVVYV